jgi:hypothetical protein
MSTVAGRDGRNCIPAQGRSAKSPPREPGISRIFLGGLAGTVALALTRGIVDPLLSGRPTEMSRLWSGTPADPHAVGGAVFHLFNGLVLFPMGYAFLSARIPGSAIVKGLIWGTFLWGMAEELIVPILGSGFFSDLGGGLRTTLISLAGYLVYGALQGLIAGTHGD